MGCADSEDFQQKGNRLDPYASLHINQDEALDISQKVMKHSPTTRSANALASPIFSYVTNGASTRYASVPDTLAYVINYPNNGGFVIVSSDKRVYPVLAYSYNGNFSMDNEIAKANFIDNIGGYINEASANVVYEVSDKDFDGCYSQSPKLQTSIHQKSPWDKYVVEENPGCPVGCVAVATALVLTHSTPMIKLHGSAYSCKSIVNAISAEQNKDKGISFPTFREKPCEWDEVEQPTYTYQQAVDSMAKILYWIGKDLKMQYSPSVSLAYSEDAYDLCRILGVKTSRYNDYDVDDVITYLKNQCMIYMRGIDMNGNGGHAWVCDGYSYCVDSDDKTKMVNQYIHCDWGFGGDGNGYFCGEIFEAAEYRFKPLNYFAVKRGRYDVFTITTIEK